MKYLIQSIGGMVFVITRTALSAVSLVSIVGDGWPLIQGSIVIGGTCLTLELVNNNISTHYDAFVVGNSLYL
jgi:hypothetical protein